MSNNEKYGSITISPTLITDKEEKHDLYRTKDLCGVNGIIETVIVNETISEKQKYGGYLSNWDDWELTSDFTLSEDSSYTVIFNGAVYENLTATFIKEPVDDSTDPAFVIGSVDNTEYPFIILNRFSTFRDAPSSVCTAAGVYESIEIKIVETKENIAVLDEKFIPAACKVGMDVSGKTFNTTLGDIVAGEYAEMFNDYLQNVATGKYSHAEGSYTYALGDYSHAEGDSSIAYAMWSHAEGYLCGAKGVGSHAEGYASIASGEYSHSEGMSEAEGECSHAEGNGTRATGNRAHTEGYATNASGPNSHAEGCVTKASGEHQHVQGKFNIDDVDSEGNPLNTYAHIVGNGTATNKRSNAHTLDWDGNAWYAGYVESTYTILKSSTEGSTKRFKVTVDDSGTLTATEITA